MFFLRKNFLIFLSIVGIIISLVFTFTRGQDIEAPTNQLTEPPSSSFEHTISGIGFIEASSGNINISSFTPGIVAKVNVVEGQQVTKGDILFILDQQMILAEISRANTALEIAESELRLAKIQLADSQDKYDRAKGLKSGKSISEEKLKDRYFALEKVKVDITIKENKIAKAKSELGLVQVKLDRTEVRSPIDATILKVRINPGEFISGNEQESDSPILIGNEHPLYVRVQVDENDIWRFDKKAKTIAYLRSNKDVKIPLKFVQIEPYADSKKNIKGQGIELIDTRIIDIIYQIDNNAKEQFTRQLFIGQQLDVFIESAHSP